MKRRDLFVSATSAIVASVSTQAMAKERQPDHAALIAVIEQLEAYQGWETCDVIWTKAFAAYRLRQAMGLPLPGSTFAEDHVQSQRARFESWKRTVWYERDLSEGRAAMISPWEREL